MAFALCYLDYASQNVSNATWFCLMATRNHNLNPTCVSMICFVVPVAGVAAAGAFYIVVVAVVIAGVVAVIKPFF